MISFRLHEPSGGNSYIDSNENIYSLDEYDPLRILLLFKLWYSYI